MKLNYKRTIFVGFAFFLICTFWNAYDTIIPKILTDKFGMTQANSGIIMALDNVLALFMLPLFGAISDKCRHKLGRRTPFILLGTLVAAVMLDLTLVTVGLVVSVVVLPPPLTLNTMVVMDSSSRLKSE